jgi:uncharacterized membrane protein
VNEKLDPFRHHRRVLEHHAGAFGTDSFGAAAERFARFFGTAKFILGQTLIIILWIVLNAVALIHHWDPYPFILLNLLFSTQAAYAAPLILLAQTRQAERDKATSEADVRHREDLAKFQSDLLQENTEITKAIHSNTSAIEEILRRVGAITKQLGLNAGSYEPPETG